MCRFVKVISVRLAKDTAVKKYETSTKVVHFHVVVFVLQQQYKNVCKLSLISQLGWVTVFGRYHVISHPGQLSLLPSAGRESEMSTGQSAVMLCGW